MGVGDVLEYLAGLLVVFLFVAVLQMVFLVLAGGAREVLTLALFW